MWRDATLQVNLYRFSSYREIAINFVERARRNSNVSEYTFYVRTEEARAFADNLERLARGPKHSAGRYCSLCGEPLVSDDDVCRLKKSGVAHYDCFRQAVIDKKVRRGDLEEACVNLNPSRVQLSRDFSNVSDENATFKYEIDALTQKSIHLYLHGKKPNYDTKHYCLTAKECQQLASDIRTKLDEIDSMYLDTCIHCGERIYQDNGRYRLKSGQRVHLCCMEQFTRSDESAKVEFPAEIENVHGFVNKLLDSHDPYDANYYLMHYLVMIDKNLKYCRGWF